jgi:hypothetical protein
MNEKKIVSAANQPFKNFILLTHNLMQNKRYRIMRNRYNQACNIFKFGIRAFFTESVMFSIHCRISVVCGTHTQSPPVQLEMLPF